MTPSGHSPSETLSEQRWGLGVCNLRNSIRLSISILSGFVGLAMIAAGAWGFFLLNDAGPEVEVALSDYAIAIELIGGGLGMIGLAQALHLLLEVNERG
jgi:hypothetical protein